MSPKALSDPRHRSDAPVRDFYRGLGSRMFEPRYLTAEVAEYLTAETEQLGQWVGSHGPSRHLVEVGCGPGLHLQWAIEHGADYDGVDLVADLVRLARRRAAAAAPLTRCRLHVGSCERLDRLWRRQRLHTARLAPVVLLPFNAFGNLARPEQAARALCETGAPVLVSCFDVTGPATAAREAYYTRLGYRGLQLGVDRRGVLITSRDGLHSHALKAAALTALFTQGGYVRSAARALGRVGRLYVFVPG